VARADADGAPAQTARIVLTTMTLGSFSAAVGPLILVPSLVTTNAIGFLMQATTRRWVVVGASCAAILLPLSLEWLGLVPPSYTVHEGRTIVNDRLMSFTETTHLFLIAFTVAFIVAIGLYFIRFREMLTEAERRVFLNAWQLRQLVPPHDQGPAR
jgi:serine/threonine-protein kinase